MPPCTVYVEFYRYAHQVQNPDNYTVTNTGLDCGFISMFNIYLGTLPLTLFNTPTFVIILRIGYICILVAQDTYALSNRPRNVNLQIYFEFCSYWRYDFLIYSQTFTRTITSHLIKPTIKRDSIPNTASVHQIQIHITQNPTNMITNISFWHFSFQERL